MSDNRQAIKTLSDGTTVVLKSYITAREARTFKNILIGGVKLGSSESDVPSISDVNADALAAEEDAEIQAVVLELNGSTENIVSRVLDLPSSSFDELKALIKQVVDGESFLASSSKSA